MASKMIEARGWRVRLGAGLTNTSVDLDNPLVELHTTEEVEFVSCYS